VRRKRRAGAKAREMKIIVTTTWSRELGLELPTPSIMHACLSVRREFRHLLTGLRIRNAGTREPGSQSHPVGEREARDTASATPRRSQSHTAHRPRAPARTRRGATATARGAPAVAATSQQPSIRPAAVPGRSSRLIPGDCSPHTDISGGSLRISEGSRWNRRQASRIQRVGLSL